MMTFGTDYTYSTIDSTTGGITQTYAYYYSTYYQTTDYPTGGGGGKYLRTEMNKLRQYSTVQGN